MGFGRIYAMKENDPYHDFTQRLKLLVRKHPTLIRTTLSNIFTMRLIGNKTHGDLAEIAIAEFINQYMYDFRSTHVGKDLFRAKSKEEDIRITNEITNLEIPVSLKAYGDGPLQLSTDKNFLMFPRLQCEQSKTYDELTLTKIFQDPAFEPFGKINILPLIYDEKKQRCNILVFDYVQARKATARIALEASGRGRKHPVYKFYDRNENYICEVRYGGPEANALQRGLWTNTKRAVNFFSSITGGWIDYSHNMVLVSLFSRALVSSELGHSAALEEIMSDISSIKQNAGLSRG